MAGRGGLRALRERFSMHEWAPPTAGVNFVVLGRPVGDWPSAPANQRTEGGIWPRGPMKPPIGHNTPPTDGWVLSAEQIKRVWDAQQGGSRNIRWEIETRGIEWMNVACGRQGGKGLRIAETVQWCSAGGGEDRSDG